MRVDIHGLQNPDLSDTSLLRDQNGKWKCVNTSEFIHWVLLWALGDMMSDWKWLRDRLCEGLLEKAQEAHLPEGADLWIERYKALRSIE